MQGHLYYLRLDKENALPKWLMHYPEGHLSYESIGFYSVFERFHVYPYRPFQLRLVLVVVVLPGEEFTTRPLGPTTSVRRVVVVVDVFLWNPRE